ncbi:MAG TPA: hypothetical protein VMU26_04345 [Candidatus Polarisedimenticolia bacterium]|nr:hypothetical protein [Candidatus Polarisedimenticolia bacterium]
MTDKKPRYKFVAGRGDDAHATELSELQDYKATLMVFDSSQDALKNNRKIVVLMERESQ